MDWGRAKTILILTFLVLNVMLGFELWWNRPGLNGPGSQTDIAINEIKQILAIKGISMQAEIPKEMPNLKKYVVKLEEEIGRKNAELSPAVSLAGPPSAGKLEAALGSAIPRLREYVLDTLQVHSDEYVLHQLLANHPVYGIELRLYQRNGSLNRYDQRYVQTISEVDPDQPILSAALAFRRLLESDDLQAPATVREIRLGLSYRPFDNSEGLAVPTWRVAVETGTGQWRWFYIDAFSGEVSEGLKLTADETD